MTGGVGTSHVVGVNVVQEPYVAVGSPTTLLVTITGGDTTGLSKIMVINGSQVVNASTGPFSVGQPISFEGGLGAGPASISIVGTFPDGAQTIYTGTINLI